MKILLVNPPASERFPSASRVPPLGLAYIAAALEKDGLSAQILDASVEELSVEGTAEKIMTSGADIVGFTAMTPNYPQTEEIAILVRQKNPDIKAAIGGSHATFLPEKALESGFDFVVRGEGERTFLELCRKIGKKENDFETVDGLSWKKEGKILHNKNREFVKNLDELPFPAYHLLDIEAYQNKAPPSNVRGGRWLSYSSSRGCPFGCFYCSVTNFWGKIWRGHSAERIVSDLEQLKKNYDLKSVFFVDDNFTFRRERIMELCRLMKEKNLNLEWSCSCRVDQVDLELLKEMKVAGCWRIGFGVEAGTQKVIDWYGKKITIEKAENAMKMCRKAGISTFCFFIVGAPVETESDMQKTINAAKRLNPDIVGVSYLTPFPGSKLYDYCIENKLVASENFSDYSEDVPVISGATPKEKIIRVSKKFYREFYFRPSYMLKQAGAAFRNPKLALRGFKTILGWARQKK